MGSFVIDIHPEADMSLFSHWDFVWSSMGLWVGFAILAAGTFVGEIATWAAFKWCCQTRAAKQVTFSLTLIGMTDEQ